MRSTLLTTLPRQPPAAVLPHPPAWLSVVRRPMATTATAITTASAAGGEVRVPRTCIVGSGPTGAVLAHLLARERRDDGKTPLTRVVVLDKGRQPGGRMTTTRAVELAVGSRADSGAQYITESPASRHKAVYAELHGAGVLSPLQGTILGQRGSQKVLRNSVAPAGLASVVRHLLASAAPIATVLQSKQVTGIVAEAIPTRGGPPASGWTVTCADGSKDTYDAVVITIPVPQVLKLEGDIPALVEGSGTGGALAAVRYSTRYALVLYFNSDDWDRVATALPYVGRYVDSREDDIIRYISFDSAKRGVPRLVDAGDTSGGSNHVTDLETPAPTPAGKTWDVEPCPSVVIHTSVEFGDMYADTDPIKVAPIVIDHVRRLHPGLPEVVESKCHRWRYSQVTQAYHGPEPYVTEAGEGVEVDVVPSAAEAAAGGAGGGDGMTSKPGAVAREAAAASNTGSILLFDRPPLLLAGDAFTTSNFNGCIDSAEKAAWLLKRMLLAP